MVFPMCLIIVFRDLFTQWQEVSQPDDAGALQTRLLSMTDICGADESQPDSYWMQGRLSSWPQRIILNQQKEDLRQTKLNFTMEQKICVRIVNISNTFQRGIWWNSFVHGIWWKLCVMLWILTCGCCGIPELAMDITEHLVSGELRLLLLILITIRSSGCVGEKP